MTQRNDIITRQEFVLRIWRGWIRPTLQIIAIYLIFQILANAIMHDGTSRDLVVFAAIVIAIRISYELIAPYLRRINQYAQGKIKPSEIVLPTWVNRILEILSILVNLYVIYQAVMNKSYLLSAVLLFLLVEWLLQLKKERS